MAQAPEHPGDLTASDVFATGVWSARGGKPALGVDIACTKIAIDLQNVRRGSLDNVMRDSLNSLRDSSNADTAFVWMFSADGTAIVVVTHNPLLARRARRHLTMKRGTVELVTT